MVDGNEDCSDDPFRASAATAEVLDALSNRHFHQKMKGALNAEVRDNVFTMCDNNVIHSATSDNVQEWKEEMKIVVKIENVLGENDTTMNLSLPKHVNSLDKLEKERILNNFELGKDANKEARCSLFADEKTDAERKAERAENHRVGALGVARFEANMVADMKKMYQQLFNDEVVPKLKRLKFDDSKILKSSMLNKKERCAFVFAHFKQFHKHKGRGQISHEGIKQILKAKMEQNISWSNYEMKIRGLKETLAQQREVLKIN